MWWLSGSSPAIGAVLDDLAVPRVGRIAVALPPTAAPAAVDTGMGSVPPVFNEPEVANNPNIYTDGHMPSERFQLTPAAALARVNAMLSSGEDDPLFRPIEGNDFRVNGAAAHAYTNLTVNGLGVVPPVQDRAFIDAEVPALLAYLRRI